jgi:hypothetical protein
LTPDWYLDNPRGNFGNQALRNRRAGALPGLVAVQEDDFSEAFAQHFLLPER